MKVLRVRITDEEWKKLEPYVGYGGISKILRRAIKDFLKAPLSEKVERIK
jgi:hypothetical protein